MMIKLIKSFGYAFKGIYVAFISERNLQIHALAIGVVSIAGWYFQLSLTEWAVITIIFGLVVSAELLNTAIEKLVDMVSPDYHAEAGRVKDIAAGAVLITAIVAVVVALLIFGEKILNLL